ncbi:DUF4910 domain-containing protein [Aneurinibacillus migulanus]|uniref:DUF4910 domain-containing protein n=1 Tax=Aneurinibacillus migulanus TaxID=47500 RepID=UPI002E1C106D|nr:DUF4910 domain-containing protein [Aneurinibacillus migulanus]
MRTDEINKQQELIEMDRLFDRLFPICRSITGPGLRETLSILREYVPLDTLHVPTGTKVLDWEIPQEWRIRAGWLKGPDGRKIVDFSDSNLHVINYSEPVDEHFSLKELKPHLHTLPHLPDAIPYVISYYKRRWGFCLPYRVYETLPEGQYHAYIDSEFVHGELTMAHAILPGESEKEILISSYICHPSMANNELSGPIVAAFLYRRLAAWKNRRFTYRFVFVPETIGSISYLHHFGHEMKEKVHTGLVLTCLGGTGKNKEEIPLSYKYSRKEHAPIDEIVAHLFEKGVIEGNTRPFTPAFGSDERQYCSPGFNLPIGQMARMVYGWYEGYHNSLDTKEFMTIEALYRSVNEIENVLYAVELDGYYVNRHPYGEIKLDKHNLYPDMNGPSMRGKSNNTVVDGKTFLHRLLTMLNYADGEHTLREIAVRCSCSILDMKPIIRTLQEKNLLVGPFVEKRGISWYEQNGYI